MAIAEVSSALAMHPQTLRKYERAGLVRPGRRAGGSRAYSEEDLRRLVLIKQMAENRGVNVAGMALLLALRDDLLAIAEEFRALDSGEFATLVHRRIHDALARHLPQA
jgi:DNA-binding transcriptional MerR regulator